MWLAIFALGFLFGAVSAAGIARLLWLIATESCWADSDPLLNPPTKPAPTGHDPRP